METSDDDTEPTLREAGEQLRDDFALLRSALGNRAGELRDRLSSLVEEHPLAVVGCAFGAGYLLSGGLYSRSSGRLVRLATRLALAAVVRGTIARGGLEVLASLIEGRAKSSSTNS